MKRILSSLLLIACATATCASTLVHNVNGYTLDNGKLVKFSAIEFHDSKITAVYSQESDAQKSKADKRVDGLGKTMLPGLIDAHGHVLNLGKALTKVQLRGVKSEEDAVARVTAFIDKNPNASWIQGRGWNQVLWENNSFPTAKSLDAIAPLTPVVLTRVDGHARWLNSEALKRTGINSETPDPQGGKIVRDNDGKATGILIDNAMTLVDDIIPVMSDAEIENALVKALKHLASEGLTSVHDAGIMLDNLAAYQRLAQNNKLPIRVNAMLDVTDPNYLSMLKMGVYELGDSMFQVNSVKISADGALGSRGAALHEDYSDQPGNKGLLLHTNDRLKLFIESAMSYGFQVNTHAIGDFANSKVLDDYEELIKKTDSAKLRHRIEHAQVLRLEDLRRFKDLGVIASMQPTHATSDKNMAEDRVGPQRIKGAYAWRTIMETGAIIAGGSDFPVESSNPFFGLHAAVTRQDHADEPKEGWYPEQKLTLTEALALFTTNAAYAGHQEHIIGELKPGMAADFIITDIDIFNTDAKNLWGTEVQATWVAGKLVYQHPLFFLPNKK